MILILNIDDNNNFTITKQQILQKIPKMQIEQTSHTQLLSQIQKCPYQLNSLTSQYLQYLRSTSYTLNCASWQSIHQTLYDLNNQQTSIQKCLLLFNVTKLVLNQTIGLQSSINKNRMYCWMSMVYGVKINYIIEQIQSISVLLQQNNDSLERDSNIMKLLEFSLYGLVMSQIMIGTVENTNKQDTNNKILYPQFYRLVDLISSSLAKFIKLDSNNNIKYNTNLKNLQQSKQQKQQIFTIKLTNILKMLKPVQNKKLKKKYSSQNLYIKVGGLIIVKIIELIDRSLAICKIKQIKNIFILQNRINVNFREIMGKDVQQNGEYQNVDKQQDKYKLKTFIKQYLQQFQTSTVPEQNGVGNVQEIDQQNKIIQVKELTPRFIDERPVMELKKLRTKKKKLIKKIQSDARKATMNRLQQSKVLHDVRNERTVKKQNKQIFIMQKQTQQAKKQHNKMKRIKQIRKGGSKKDGKSGKDGRDNKFGGQKKFKK